MRIEIVERVSDESIHGRADLQEVEQRVGGSLPDDYLEFLIESNGGRPRSAVFFFKDTDGRPTDSLVDWFFGVSKDHNYGIIPNLDTYEDLIPPGLCPIACDPFGNLVLIGASGEGHGRVYFWDHELQSDSPSMSNLSKVADSFSEFLELVN